MANQKKLKNKRPSLFTNLFLLLPVLVTSFFAIDYFRNSNFCANSISCIKNLDSEIDNGSNGTFEGRLVFVPKINPQDEVANPNVLGDETPSGDKHILVDLSKQTLYAYDGDNLYMDAKISSGKWHPTPTGDFSIWIKLRSTRMTGGTGADFYDLPNVPYVMFFSNNVVPKSAGYSLHGAYWHDNFGHAMSHGCVNMRTIDAKKLYEWVTPVAKGLSTLATSADPGTKVTITGEAP